MKQQLLLHTRAKPGEDIATMRLISAPGEPTTAAPDFAQGCAGTSPSGVRPSSGKTACESGATGLRLGFNSVIDFDRDRNERKVQMALPVGACAWGYWVRTNKICPQYVVGGTSIQRRREEVVRVGSGSAQIVLRKSSRCVMPFGFPIYAAPDHPVNLII